jgi:hypothetical protein
MNGEPEESWVAYGLGQAELHKKASASEARNALNTWLK